jgi:hypothetical protein
LSFGKPLDNGLPRNPVQEFQRLFNISILVVGVFRLPSAIRYVSQINNLLNYAGNFNAFYMKGIGLFLTSVHISHLFESLNLMTIYTNNDVKKHKKHFQIVIDRRPPSRFCTAQGFYQGHLVFKFDLKYSNLKLQIDPIIIPEQIHDSTISECIHL